jgi:hypothetical protein
MRVQQYQMRVESAGSHTAVTWLWPMQPVSCCIDNTLSPSDTFDDFFFSLLYTQEVVDFSCQVKMINPLKTTSSTATTYSVRTWLIICLGGAHLT